MEKGQNFGESRRQFCRRAVGTALTLVPFTAGGAGRVFGQEAQGVHFSVMAYDRERICRLAEEAMKGQPLQLSDTAPPGRRDPQNFYSEQRANGVLEKDGDVTPFLGHVDLLVEMSSRLSALTAAWRLDAQSRYFDAALQQMQVWFVDSKTRMLPTLQDAGTVLGMEDDRNNGLTETVALAECARAVAFLCAAPKIPEHDALAVRAWFEQMLQWLVESKKGDIARQSKSITAICWTMQAAEFARFVRNDTQYRMCTHLFRENLLRQMNFDGYFPLALRDPNPYATSMFAFECMAAACESLSTPFESLWTANLPDGRGMHSATAWAMPYLRDRSKWPFVADRDHFQAQRMRGNALLFAGRAFDQPDYIDVWKSLPADAVSAAIKRIHPITQPALWTVRPPA